MPAPSRGQPSELPARVIDNRGHIIGGCRGVSAANVSLFSHHGLEVLTKNQGTATCSFWWQVYNKTTGVCQKNYVLLLSTYCFHVTRISRIHFFVHFTRQFLQSLTNAHFYNFNTLYRFKLRLGGYPNLGIRPETINNGTTVSFFILLEI